MATQPQTIADVSIIGYSLVPPDQLLAHPLNARRHPNAQRDALRASLRSLGWIAPVVVNRTSGHVLDGHARIEEALSADVPLVPVVEVALSPEQEALALATFDPITAMAAYDRDALDMLLREVDTGEAALQQLLADVAKGAGLDYGAGPVEAPEAQIDRAAELQAQWGTVLGQSWRLGEHRLVIGDCTDAAVVEAVLAGARPVLMATDPPYGVELDQGWRDRIGLNRLGRSQDDALAGDDRVDWADAYRLGGADVAVIWHAGIYAGTVAASLEAAGYEVLQQIVWVKNMAPLSRSYYHWRHEPAWFARRKGSAVPWHVGRDQTTVWEAASPKHIMSGSTETKQDHPTQKPVVLWLTPIQNHTARGEWVYEPFAGSGTALVACEQLGRRCAAVELSPSYAAVIVQRWVDATGQEPVCESGR